MASIWALEDRQEEHLQRLGDVRMLKEFPCGTLRVKKRVNVSGAGTYTQKADLPLYRPRTIRQWRQTPDGRDAKLLGVLSPKSGRDPVGFVQRRQDARTFCLPVGPVGAYQGVGWRIKGFLVCDRGCVAVAGRRVLFWAALALGAALVFGVSYQMARYGVAQGWQMLAETLRDIPEAAEGKWFALMHRL